MKRTIARERLFLNIGFFAGVALVPLLAYSFLSPDSYTESHALHEAYVEFLGILLGSEGIGTVLLAAAIALLPYFVFQFGRSIMWAIRTVHST